MGQGFEGIRFREAVFHGFAQLGHEFCFIAQTVRTEHKRNTRCGYLRRIGGRHFPVLELRHAHLARIYGVFHVEGFREIERQDEGCAGFFDLVQAFVLVAAAFDDVFHIELLAQIDGAKYFLPVGHFKYLRQCGQIVPGGQRDVVLVFVGFVPLSVVISLAQQRNGAHERAGIPLAGTAFAEGEMVRRFVLHDEGVFAVVGQRDESGTATRDAVVLMAEYCSETYIAQGFGCFFVGGKDLVRPEFRLERLVPVVGAFLRAEVLLGASEAPSACRAVLSHSGHAVVGIHINEGRIDGFAFEINDNGVGRHGYFQAHRLHFSVADEQGGFVQALIIGSVNGGIGEGVEALALVVDAVDREGFLCSSEWTGDADDGNQHEEKSQIAGHSRMS